MTKEKLLKLSKILVLVFMSLTFLNVLLPDGFIIGIEHYQGTRLNPFQMIVRWFNFASFVILPIAVFYDRKVFKKIAIYFCLPIAIIYFCLIGEILPWFMSEKGISLFKGNGPDFFNQFVRNGIFRGFIFVATSLAQLGVIGLLIHRDWKVVKFAKKEILPFVLLLLASIFTIIPIYALEAIFNTRDGNVFKPFGIYHIGWIVVLIAEFVLFTLFFKKRSEEDRYILVLVLALSLFLQFNQLFTTLQGGLTCKRMPLQLCNIAAYVILISIIFRSRSLFLFNILINVAGGIIALFVMDAVTDRSIIAQGNVHYIVEHNNVILVPLLCLTLGVFKPITWKDFKAFALYFTGYFLIVFILGTIFNSIYLQDTVANSFFYCNYMFMFDQETAARLVGFAGNLFNFKAQIGPFVIYYVIQPVIYIVFFAIGTGMFALLKACVKEKKQPELE